MCGGCKNVPASGEKTDQGSQLPHSEIHHRLHAIESMSEYPPLRWYVKVGPLRGNKVMRAEHSRMGLGPL